MLEVKQYSEVKKGIRYIPFDLNTNSRIYIKGLDLTKVPKKHIMFGSKEEQLLKYIDEKNLEGCVRIKRLLYKGDRLVAYTIKFYKDHKSLRKLLRKNIDLKKQDCLKIEQAFNELSKNNLQFIDYNLSNILLDKNGNVIVCDLESLIINEEEKVKLINNKNLLILVLSYLYKIPTNEISALVRHQANFLLHNNQELMNLFNRLHNGENVRVQEIVDLITEEDVKGKRLSLKRNVARLRDSGYYGRYF